MESKICLWCEREFCQRSDQKDHHFRQQKFCSSKCCQAAYRRSEKGRATRQCYLQSENYRASERRYVGSDKWLAKEGRYAISAKGRARRKRGDQRYRATEKGRINTRRCNRRYYATEEGRAATKRGQQRYQATEKYQATQRGYAMSKHGRTVRRQYQQSEAGRAAARRYAATKKGRLTRLSHGQSKHRYRMLYVEKLSCCQCGKSDDNELQVDHILAVGLGGSNLRENLQVLCNHCHNIKTRSDRHKMRVRRLAPITTVDVDSCL